MPGKGREGKGKEENVIIRCLCRSSSAHGTTNANLFSLCVLAFLRNTDMLSLFLPNLTSRHRRRQTMSCSVRLHLLRPCKTGVQAGNNVRKQGRGITGSPCQHHQRRVHRPVRPRRKPRLRSLAALRPPSPAGLPSPRRPRRRRSH